MVAIKRDRGVLHLRRGVLLRLTLESQKAVRIAHGQRAERNVVERGKDRDRGADAYRQHEYRDDGETRRRPHGSEGVSQILAEPIEPHESPGLACVLAMAQRIPQRHAAALLSHFTMKRHFPGELVVKSAAIEQVVE